MAHRIGNIRNYVAVREPLSQENFHIIEVHEIAYLNEENKIEFLRDGRCSRLPLCGTHITPTMVESPFDIPQEPGVYLCLACQSIAKHRKASSTMMERGEYLLALKSALAEWE